MSKDSKERQDWTGEELDLIVTDYFSMLRDEAAGLAFNKAAHNRALQSQIDRSEGSIEFKHRNISAVLERIGLQPINGYLPAANIQRALIGAVERYLDTNQAVLHPERRIVPELAERPALFLQNPPEHAVPEAQPEVLKRLIRKFDPAERDFRNRTLGRNGEELVFEWEREHLERAGRTDLAKNIRWVSKDDGDGAGYDILSFEPTGEERFLEVKTTVGPKRTPFYITRNELSFAKERADSFRLCRVYDFSKQPQMFKLTPPLTDHVRLSPLSFEASPL
jgi:hypothetical protein